MSDEATVAREALTRANNLLATFHDHIGARDWALLDNDAEEIDAYLRSLPSPAPRKVRARSNAGPLEFVLDFDGCLRVKLWNPREPSRALWVDCDELQNAAALFARADAEGMVEEGLGQTANVAGAPKNEGNPLGTSPAPTPAPYSETVERAETTLASWEFNAELERVTRERDEQERVAKSWHEQFCRAGNERRAAQDEASTLRAQLAAATGPVSQETFDAVCTAIRNTWLVYGPPSIARAAIKALGRTVEGV